MDSGFSFFAFETCDEELVDPEALDIDDLEPEAGGVCAVGFAGHAAEAVHDEAADGVEGCAVGKVGDAEFADDIADGGGAIDQPGVFVAADDGLFLERVGETVHQRAHDVLEGDESDDHAVFADDEGEAGAVGVELGESVPEI